MKKALRLALLASLSLPQITLGSAIITSVTDGTTVFNGNAATSTIIATSFTSGGNTFSILDGASVTSQTGGASSGNLFFGPGAANPGGFNQALSDSDILTGQFNGEDIDFNFSGVASTDVFAIFFRGASTTFDQAFDNNPTEAVLVDSSGVVISDTLNLATGPTALTLVTFDRGNMDTSGSAVGGVTFNAADFTINAGSSFADVAGVRFPADAGSDPTAVFRAELVPIPEPSTSILGALSALFLLGRRRR